MKNSVLKVENLSKLYRLGEVGTGTLSHDLNRWWASIRGKDDPYKKIGQVNDRNQKSSKSEFVWALKDVSFEVEQGEVLGIIGNNGAGKSTLLKLISRITSPTTGSVKARGRIASLLEVGTGMHPEMTARENIFLNGAILGMTKREIKNKFDEIIDFAGCTLYVDTPIKRFSSGMRVRLGFAVAAFLEPEILIVDEVLAVGDFDFQKKAIGKMKEVSHEGGRTVLFVSHNLNSVKTICDRGILLQDGMMKDIGSVTDIVNSYIGTNRNAKKAEAEFAKSQFQNSYNFRLLKSTLRSADGEIKNVFRTGEKLIIETEYTSSLETIPNLSLAYGLYDVYNQKVCDLWNRVSSSSRPDQFIPGKATSYCVIPKLPLGQGDFTINITVKINNTTILHQKGVLNLNIEPGNYFDVEFATVDTNMKFQVDNEWSFDDHAQQIEVKS